jgi:hypothetical protein
MKYTQNITYMDIPALKEKLKRIIEIEGGETWDP